MITINIPAKDFAKLVKQMDKCPNEWEATDKMINTLSNYMEDGCFEKYVKAYYNDKL